MPRPSDYVLDVRVWDVAHGSAAYIRAGNKDVVLDCGAGPEFSPLKWLNNPYYGLNALDYLIISHPHEDHIEDLDTLKELGLNNADLIFQRPKRATSLVKENLKKAKREGNDELVEDAQYYLNVLDEFDQTPDVLPREPKWAMDVSDFSHYRTDGGIPHRGVTIHNFGTNKLLGSDRYEKLNNLSRVTVVDAFGFRLVSAGDLLKPGINEIKDDNEAMDAIRDAEVLIAPHHGRKSSFDSEFVSHVNPELVVFSDKDAKHTVSGKYGRLTNGKTVYDENQDTYVSRKVLSTNNDGRIRIQANNGSDWSASMYGRDYATAKASTKRYQKSD